jgi:hypothetical protein
MKWTQRKETAWLYFDSALAAVLFLGTLACILGFHL